jgi:hypothetical protein
MLDFALGVLIFVGRAINFVLDIMLTVTRLQRIAELLVGAPPAAVKVPSDPTAQRALAEAEQRHHPEAAKVNADPGAGLCVPKTLSELLT